jgi:hypothetical protein
MSSHSEGWDRGVLILEAHKRREKYPEERLGQALYNVAYSHNPAVASLADVYGIDCFYRDNYIEAFLDALGAKWK